MIKAVNDFISKEALSGLILIGAAALAIILDNSALAPLYDQLLATRFGVEVNQYEINKPLLLWINDGLMAIFFLLIGLEIKREVLEGELSSAPQIAMPGLAAIGGMAAPALVFVLINSGDADALKGWAIPAATDIAFALGVLSLLGKRVPPSLKVFLLALAIIDDLGAIIVIAVFYTANLSLTALGLAAVGVIMLAVLNRMKVMGLTPYFIVGLFIWVCVLKSGVHATLAGVVVAMAIPMRHKDNPEISPLKRLEHAIHPWIAWFIMPVFAFANAGVSFVGFGLDSLLTPLPLGIAAGLLLGKPLGILAGIALCRGTGLARLPEGAGWLHMLGISWFAGIGFTMSLFIGTLAFSDPSMAAGVRFGVISGSVLAALLGSTILIAASRREGQ